jgi:hypothetical protein
VGEGARLRFSEWKRYVVGVLEEGAVSDPEVRKTLEEVRAQAAVYAHRAVVAVARLVAKRPHLETAYRVLPDPEEAERWVRELCTYASPATADFFAWKAATAVRLARAYAERGDPRLAEALGYLPRARRDSVPALVALILEADRELAGAVAPSEERVGAWLRELQGGAKPPAL